MFVDTNDALSLQRRRRMAKYFNLDDPAQYPERLFADDGLLDILLGVAFIGAAFAMWYDVVWLFSILPLTVLVLWPGLKERVTASRMTEDEIQRATQLEAHIRRRKLTVVSLLTGLMVLGMVTLLAFQVDAAWMDSLWPFVMMAIGLVIIAMPGYAFGTQRFYTYAAVTLAFWLLCYWLALPAPVAVAMPGAMLLLGGVYILGTFLRTHPKLR
jgi:MFS family permease